MSDQTINILFWIAAVVSGCCVLLAVFGPGPKQKPYQAPVIKKASYCDGELHMEVAAQHSRHIQDELDLPAGTWIETIKANHLYRVDAPVPLQGNEMSDREICDAGVQLARNLGFNGKVRMA